MIVSRAEKVSQFFWCFIALRSGWTQGVQLLSLLLSVRKMTGKDKVWAGYQSIYRYQLTHQSWCNGGSEPILAKAGAPWITGRSRNPEGKKGPILCLRACFTSDSVKKIWLKGLQNTSESAFSYSSISWMEDDGELSDCGRHASDGNAIKCWKCGSTRSSCEEENKLIYCCVRSWAEHACCCEWRSCVRETGHSKLTDREWQCYAELLCGGLQWC